MMHGRGKSDEAIVAMKAANQAAQAGREPVERRAEAKGNAGQTNTRRTQSRESVSQGLERIREVHCFAVITQGGSRMRESCTYGSVRGALSNGRPYRDRQRAHAFGVADNVREAWARFALPTLQRLCQLGQQLEHVAHQPIVGDREDRRVGVLVDGDDHFRVLHAGKVLDGA